MKTLKFLAVTFALSALSSFAAQADYNVMDYGAVADTTVLSTKAFQAAVDDCAQRGGGTVIVPAGDYKCGSIFLKDNINLYLSAGATIYASRNPRDFRIGDGPDETVGIDGAELLIGAIDARNVSISGYGTLNCRAVRETYRRSPQPEVRDSVTGREVANAHKYGADYRTKFRRVPPCPGAINFTNCTDVHINGIRVVESSVWSVHLLWCDRVYLNGVYITSDPHCGVNADGLDIDGCSNVMVSDCRIETGDDAICIKTTSQNGSSRPCRYVTVTNCVLTSSSAAFKIGTETHSDVENITFSNSVIHNSNRGLNMIIRDGGTVRNVVMSNLVINTNRHETFWWGNGDPIWFTIQRRDPAPSAGGIENVVISDVIAHGESGIRMEGFSEHIKNVRMNNVQLFMHPENAIDKRSRHGYYFEGVDGLSLTDCSVTWDKANPEPTWEKAFEYKDVTRLKTQSLEGEDIR